MMKKILTLMFAATLVVTAAASSSAQVLITEIVDGDRIAANGDAGAFANGDPNLAFVELTNVGSSAANLFGLHINNFNNGNDDSSNGSTALSGTLQAGETFYYAYEGDPAPAASAFERVYGFAPNVFAGGKFVNGDDVIALLNTEYVGGSGVPAASTIVDVYGALGTDGTGEPWEYTDTQASRLPSIGSPNSTFTLAEWSFGTVNANDGQNAAFYAANTSVVGPASVVPEPSSIALLGLVGLAGVIRRRK